MIRLQHYLSQAGICSRREGERWIKGGLVKVNDSIIRELGTSVDPIRDAVQCFVGGKWIDVKDSSKAVVYALNKPYGFTVTTADPHADRIVTELVPVNPRVYPVGRLDKDSEGLILLTNNGELAQKISHPSKHISKTYMVVLKYAKGYDLSALPNAISKLEGGVMIDNYRTASAKIKPVSADKQKFTITHEITICEGKNRQVRKMYQKIGLNVLRLERIAIGKLKLSDLNLATGKYTILTQKDIEKIWH